MAINRAPWNALVDDDGSNLVGSIWNKAAIQTVLLDPIDAAILPVYGTSTPVDASGAGLVFQAGSKTIWAKYDRLVYVWMQIVYPATASGLGAQIAQVPYLVRSPVGVSQGYGVGRGWWIPENDVVIRPHNITTFSPTPNSELSGANLIISCVYLTD